MKLRERLSEPASDAGSYAAFDRDSIGKSTGESITNFNVTPEFCSFTVERRINPEENLETSF